MAVTCTGCGATLQSAEQNAPGYVPESAFHKEHPLCRRCFRIRHYGEFSRVALPLSEYVKQVSLVLSRPGLVLYVLDVFDLGGSMLPALREYIGNSPVIAVVNKVDLLPQDVHPERLRRWITEALNDEGISPVDVCFVSAEKNQGFDILDKAIARRMETRVYAVGMANVGKSSILNALARHIEAPPPFTESHVPGTTLANTQVEMTFVGNRRKTVIDTPGLILLQRVTDVLCSDCLKTVIPRTPLRPKIYQLQPGQTVFLGGFARLDFVDGVTQSIVFYVSNDVVVHRTKLERADAFVDLHSDDILKSPCSSCRDALGPWTDMSVTTGGRRPGVDTIHGEIALLRQGGDIVIPGLGWITLSGAPFDGVVSVRSGVHLSLRKQLIGSLNHER